MYPVYSPLTGHDINQILAIKFFYLLKNLIINREINC